MADIVTKENRSERMSGIRSKDTKPELFLRKYLFHKGFRYRKNYKKLPGTPDIVFLKKKIAVFINGCFWHGHENCNLFKLPKTNRSFWKEKIEKNRNRDKTNFEKLDATGWAVFVFWECALRESIKNDSMDLLIEKLLLKLTCSH